MVRLADPRDARVSAEREAEEHKQPTIHELLVFSASRSAQIAGSAGDPPASVVSETA